MKNALNLQSAMCNTNLTNGTFEDAVKTALFVFTPNMYSINTQTFVLYSLHCVHSIS